MRGSQLISGIVLLAMLASCGPTAQPATEPRPTVALLSTSTATALVPTTTLRQPTRTQSSTATPPPTATPFPLARLPGRIVLTRSLAGPNIGPSVQEILVVENGITTTLPITGLNPTLSANGPLLTLGRYRDREGHLLAQEDESVDYSRRQQFALYNLDTGELEDLPIFCPSFGCYELYISADKSLASLNYRCGFEESTYSIAPIAQLQAHREHDESCPVGHQSVSQVLPENQGFVVSEKDTIVRYHHDGTKEIVPENARFLSYGSFSADGSSTAIYREGIITLVRWETWTKEEFLLPRRVRYNTHAGAVLQSPDQQSFLLMTDRPHDDCIYLLRCPPDDEHPPCILQGVGLLAWLP
jgi:hypothetical protein